MALFLLVSAVALACGGCYSATGPAPGDTDEQEQFWTTQPEDVRIAALRKEMAETCPLADPAEVRAVAGVTIRYGELLREEYGLTRPPEHNNIAIALGLKHQRGRCYELADDLYVRLRALRLRTIDLHRAIAREGHLTDEHNVVIATDLGKAIETGIVLDLWRYAGKARFIAVARDHQHQWKERPITAPPPSELVADDITATHASSP
ncbi:MAG: hypothetical protein JWO31_3989 [Phycisphaerales bacterium]|nr:hypothetical protein [Phycisphaerales bacterium]